ncbi:MAG TPA: GNAT family N-acetyltransferase [Ramlibacter sp.]|nr:GNAT family N-acetyltransferase [Ramlibacter sp.]
MSADELLGASVAQLERAIVDAVAPAAVCEMEGWIVAFDTGTVSRAKSAAPLSHAAGDPRAIANVRAAYVERGLDALFRVPQLDTFDAVAQELARRGFSGGRPTDVQVARAARVARAITPTGVRIDAQPDEAWASVFLGEGFDPVDGASRVRTLTRAPGSLFASIREGDRVVAAGVLALGHGWAGIHGMRTAQSHRGQRLATGVLAALAQAALERGYVRLMLQVERENEAAQKLYARCGFERAWTYLYWK